jgi:hypothetical protein
LNGKLNGLAVRVPLLNASLTDCVFEVERSTTIAEVNNLLKTASAQKPLIGIVKFGIGIGVSWNGTAKISSEIAHTYSEIAQTYSEIRSNEGLSFQLPSPGLSLLIGISCAALIGLIKKFSNTNNTESKNEEN